MIFDYNGKKWERTRERALRRDKYQCQRCRRYGRIRPAKVVHHKKHVDQFPELAYDMDNLESLCEACHNKEHPEKGGRKRY